MSELQPAPAAALRPPDQDPLLWREGCKAAMPTWFGLAAWGLVVGIAMVKSGLSVPQALGMTMLVFSGTAQLASLPLIAAGAPVWVVFATAVVINLRFIIFSALLVPHFAHLSWPRRMALGYTVGDLTVAMFLQRFPSEQPAPGKLSYLKGLLYPSWGAWQAGSIAGIFLGSAVPAEWGLGFAGTLAIMCVLVPLAASRAALCGAVVASITAVLAHGLPFKLGLLAAVFTGMISAMLCDELLKKARAR